MEQLGFSPVSVKQTKWLALRLVKYTGVKRNVIMINKKKNFNMLCALIILTICQSIF